MDEAAEQLIRAELVRSQVAARRSIYRGIGMVAVMPIVLITSAIVAFILGGFGAFVALLVAATYMLVGGIAGISSIAGGVADHRSITKKLRSLDEVRQLPAARLIVR